MTERPTPLETEQCSICLALPPYYGACAGDESCVYILKLERDRAELMEALRELFTCNQGEDYQMADYRARALLARLEGKGE